MLFLLLLMTGNKTAQKVPKSPSFIFLGDWEDSSMLKDKVKFEEVLDFWEK